MFYLNIVSFFNRAIEFKLESSDDNSQAYDISNLKNSMVNIFILLTNDN